MLRIKSNVDLKELEKYGFELDSDTERYFKDICEDRRGAGVTMTIAIYTRLIELLFYGDDNGCAGWDYLDDTIYDMFNANIIERVREYNEEN